MCLLRHIPERVTQLRFLTLQLLEVDEHKYFRSEEARYDVGYEKALEDWARAAVRTPNETILTQAQRFRDAYDASTIVLRLACDEYCGTSCNGVGKCPMTKGRLHELLGDRY